MRMQLFLLIPLLPSVLDAAVYQPSSLEPTPEEVQILELMNRFRADPKAETARLLALKMLPSNQAPHRAEYSGFLLRVRMAFFVSGS